MDALSEMKSGAVIVCVDNETAKDNVTKMAENEGCAVMREEEGVGGRNRELGKGYKGTKRTNVC